MKKELCLNLTRQEAQLIRMWAIRDAQSCYAKKGCKTFDHRIITKLNRIYPNY